MKTKESFVSSSNAKMDRPIHILLTLMAITAIALITMGLASCSNDDNTTQSDSDQTGEIAGTVNDEEGNPYPNTLITLSKGSEKLELTTNADGNFQGTTKGIGTYNVEMVPPLSTEAISANPATVDVKADQTATVDFVIEPSPVEAVLNFGSADLFDEIRDKDGNTPTDPNEPLYAANFFEDPGLLTAIKTPDGHHVILSEYQQAKGTFKVHCNGATSIVEIALEGMIPNGTYTTWLGYLKTTKKPGEAIGPSDFVFPINPPLGASNGSENVLIADAEGKINVTIEHASCILTDEMALGVPVSYHLNGNTYGAGLIPDVEEVTQLLFYFL